MSGPTDLPRWADVFLLPLINVALAFLASGLVIYLVVGSNPLDVGATMIKGAFGSPRGIGYTLYYATTFIFAGLAVAVAFHAGLFNIGADGQGQVAGIGITLACLHLGGVPLILSLPLVMLAAMAFGAAWAFIPAYLQAKRDSHIVITTIMFNFIGAALVQYAIVRHLMPLGSGGEPKSAPYPAETFLPTLSDFLGLFGFTTRLAGANIAFLIALAAAVAIWALIWKSRLGYAIRTVGHNQVAAIYGGISPARVIVIAMLISGALSGLMGINILMGNQHKMIINYTAEAGFVGIAVSLMGRSHPFGIVLASLLFGALIQGGQELTFVNKVFNRDLITVVQGLVILFVGALEYLFKPQLTALFAGRKPAGA